jgi:hypothetical protein
MSDSGFGARYSLGQSARGSGFMFRESISRADSVVIDAITVHRVFGEC